MIISKSQASMYYICILTCKKYTIKSFSGFANLKERVSSRSPEIRTENPSGCIGWIHRSNCVFANII